MKVLEMAMTKRSWSINALAVELAHDRRTVARALARVPADKVVGGRKEWFLKTALSALNSRGSSPSTEDPRLREIERISSELESGIASIEAAKGAAAKMRVAKQIGPLIGQLDRHFHEFNAGVLDPDQRNIATLLSERAMQTAVTAFLEAAELRLQYDKSGRPI